MRAAPYDRRAYLVLADALMAKGDAWGELIGLQCALEGESDSSRFLTRLKAIEALREKLTPRLLGDAWTWNQRLKLEWAYGFVRRVTIEYLPEAPMRSSVSALLGAPGLAALQGLTAWHLEREGGGDFATFTTLLTELLPPSIRELRLGGVGALDRLLAAHPAVEELELMYAKNAFVGPAEPKLKALHLADCGPAAWHWLETASWPELKVLEAQAEDRDRSLAEALTPMRFPKLERLVLGLESIDSFLRGLEPEVLRGLKMMELTGDYGDAALEALVAARTRLHKMKRVSLTGTSHASRRLAAVVQRQLPNVTLAVTARRHRSR